MPSSVRDIQVVRRARDVRSRRDHDSYERLSALAVLPLVSSATGLGASADFDIEANRAQIDSLVVHTKRMESDDVLRALADDLKRDMGFAVERGKKRMGKLPRPVF